MSSDDTIPPKVPPVPIQETSAHATNPDSPTSSTNGGNSGGIGSGSNSGNGSEADPLALAELFVGGGEPWLPLLKPVIERQSQAATFIGPKRGPGVVPVRELTFQALKPNPPHRWKVIVFGQNPYPRVESATGIAMFDNSFTGWQDSRFGRISSIRCIIKAAAIWKHNIAKKTGIADIRKLLATHDTVTPPAWFQAMLSQGVLLLNAALTASSDGALTTDQHTAFWRPVVEVIVEAILSAKQTAAEPERGVVFAWWGVHARNLKGLVQRLERKYPAVMVKHVDHCNPAAQGDIFCDGQHFADLNQALAEVGATGIDWLPSVGWEQIANLADADTTQRMGQFITDTMELHKMYLERLQSVQEEVQEELEPITGILELPLMPFADSVVKLKNWLPGLETPIQRSQEFGQAKVKESVGKGMSADEIAALYFYTCESALYRRLNAALRDPSRREVEAFFPYLRLFLSALNKLPTYQEKLWRGVRLNLKSQYPQGQNITWWGISSCTSKLSVAQGFLGSSGTRMLFEVTPTAATGIRSFSAFTGEEEFILAPGTQLKVQSVNTGRDGLCKVQLQELQGTRLVA